MKPHELLKYTIVQKKSCKVNTKKINLKNSDHLYFTDIKWTMQPQNPTDLKVFRMYVLKDEKNFENVS